MTGREMKLTLLACLGTGFHTRMIRSPRIQAPLPKSRLRNSLFITSLERRVTIQNTLEA